MESSPEKVLEFLKELEIEASLEDLMQPSEEFYLRVINNFCTFFHIDVDKIMKLSPEQKDALHLVGEDNATIAGLLNLKQALNLISQKIFVKNFVITDFTYPVAKKTCTTIQLISNFALYIKKTLCIIDEKINEISCKAKEIQDKHKKIQENIKESNYIASKIADSKNECQQLKLKNQELELKVATQTKSTDDFDVKLKALEENILKLHEVNKKKEEEMMNCLKINEQLKSQVVQEPEFYLESFKKLEKDKEDKEETRKTVEAAIQYKKSQLKKLEDLSILINQKSDKLPEFIEIFQTLQETKDKDNNYNVQIDELTRDISRLNTETNKTNVELAEKDVKSCVVECENILSKYRATQVQLSSETNELEKKLNEIKTSLIQVNVKNEEKNEKIIKLESEIEEFLRQATDLYNKDLEELDKLYDLE